MASNHVMEPVEEIEERDAVQLVDACRRGDRDAQHAIYRLFVRQVHSLASRIVGPNDADDVTQNAFIQLFRTLDQFRGDANFRTWLYRLTVNEALGQRRRNQRSSSKSSKAWREPETCRDLRKKRVPCDG